MDTTKLHTFGLGCKVATPPKAADGWAGTRPPYSEVMGWQVTVLRMEGLARCPSLSSILDQILSSCPFQTNTTVTKSAPGPEKVWPNSKRPARAPAASSSFYLIVLWAHRTQNSPLPAGREPRTEGDGDSGHEVCGEEVMVFTEFLFIFYLD